MPLTLEQQLCDLVAQHDLSSLSITVFPDTNGDMRRFSTSAQGGGKCEFNSFDNEDTVAGSITSALERLAKARAAAFDVPTPAPMAEAA